MIKLLFLLMFLFLGHYSLRADEVPVDDQEFMNEVDSVKNPFEDGLPKPVVIAVPVINNTPPKRIVPKVEKVVPPPIVLPALDVARSHSGGWHYIRRSLMIRMCLCWGLLKGPRLLLCKSRVLGCCFKGKKFFLKVD